MLSELKSYKKVIGIKQSTRAVEDGAAVKAYVALNSQDSVRQPFVSLCLSKQIEVVEVPTMEQLGNACSIDVGAAVAVIIK